MQPTASTSARSQERHDQVEQRLAAPMMVMTVLALALLVLQLTTKLTGAWLRAVDVLNAVVWVSFAGEYLTLLRLAPARGRYIRTHPLDLLIVVLPFLRPLRLVRGVRALRLLRLARLGPLLGRLKRHTGQTVAYVIATTSVLVVAAAVAITFINGEKHGNIHGVGDGLWWAITTVTTVGYGDRFPVTAMGRVLGAILMIVGISLLSVITAALAAWFTRSSAESDSDRIARVERKLDELLARMPDPAQG